MMECEALFQSAINYELRTSTYDDIPNVMSNGIKNEWAQVKQTMQQVARNGTKVSINQNLSYLYAMINGPKDIVILVRGANVNNITALWGFATSRNPAAIPNSIADVVRDFSRFPCWVSRTGDGSCRGSFGVGFLLLCIVESNVIDNSLYTNDDLVYSFTGALHMRLSFNPSDTKKNIIQSVVTNILENTEQLTLTPLTRQHLRSIASPGSKTIKVALEESLSESFVPSFNYNIN